MVTHAVQRLKRSTTSDYTFVIVREQAVLEPCADLVTASSSSSIGAHIVDGNPGADGPELGWSSFPVGVDAGSIPESANYCVVWDASSEIRSRGCLPTISDTSVVVCEQVGMGSLHLAARQPYA